MSGSSWQATHCVLRVADYREHPQGKEEGAKTARSDINFMFKAFETGQVRQPYQHVALPVACT